MALNKIEWRRALLTTSQKKKKSKVTLYLLNLNVSSFSGAKAGVSVRIENANVLGGWSRSYSKLVLCLG